MTNTLLIFLALAALLAGAAWWGYRTAPVLTKGALRRARRMLNKPMAFPETLRRERIIQYWLGRRGETTQVLDAAARQRDGEE